MRLEAMALGEILNSASISPGKYRFVAAPDGLLKDEPAGETVSSVNHPGPRGHVCHLRVELRFQTDRLSCVRPQCAEGMTTAATRKVNLMRVKAEAAVTAKGIFLGTDAITQ